MTKRNEIYKCNICGNVVEVKEEAGGILTCCDEAMHLQTELTSKSEGSIEKHVPVLSVEGNKISVVVGSTLHPMEDDHYIEFIQLLQNGKVVFEKQLNPGEEPKAQFTLANTQGLSARAYCNKHGLWVSD